VASNKQQINWIGVVETTEKLGYLQLVSEWIRPKYCAFCNRRFLVTRA